MRTAHESEKAQDSVTRRLKLRLPASARRRYSGRLLRLGTLSTIVLLALSCAPALPGRSLPEQVGQQTLMAGSAAKEAGLAAKRAEAQLAESRRLHAEAVALLEQANGIKAFCQEVQKKIPKQRVIYIEKKVEKKAEPEEEQVEEKPVEPVGPKYSPSDAPLESMKPARGPVLGPVKVPAAESQNQTGQKPSSDGGGHAAHESKH